MKTLTELSGITMRKAAAAIAEAKRSLPKAEAPVVVEAAPPAPPEEAAQVQAEGETAAAAPAPKASPPPGKGRPAEEEPESEAVKAALDEAVAGATGLSGDRLARLRDAVKVAGQQIEDVRLVRVFGVEEPVPGARTLNGFQYLVDLAPASMRQTAAPPKKRERGGGDRGRGSGGKGAPASGGFSMDSLKDDRKGQRSGPSGGGRGRPGGGQPR